MQHLYEKMTISIRPNELVVGCYAPKLRATPMFPDYGTGWILAQMDDLPTRGNDQFAITEEQKQVLRDCCEYWKGFSLDCRVRAAVPPELQRILDHNVAYNTIFHCQSPGHFVAGFGYLLRTGFPQSSRPAGKSWLHCRLTVMTISISGICTSPVSLSCRL